MSELPNGWSLEVFTESIHVYQPATIAVKNLSPDGKFNFYGANGIIGKHTEFNHSDSELVLGCRGSVGAVHVTTPKSWINGNAMVVRPDLSKLSKDWVRFALLGGIDTSPAVTGTAQPQITRQSLSYVQIPVPPLDEQKRIVEILEEQLSRLDAGIASLVELYRKAKLLRTSMLEKLFVEEPNATYKVPMLRIADFATVKGGKRLPKGTPWSDHPTGHPYIRATNIKNGSVAIEDLVHVPADVFPKIARYIVQPGDVLITIAGTIGDVAVVPETLDGANLTENAAKISVDRAVVNPDYLCYFLQAPSIKAEIEFLSRATTQSKLALYRIETIVMPVPNLAVQDSCLRQIHELEKAHQDIAAITEQMQKLAASLRRSLLHAAFTGKLTKEPANV